MSSTTPNYDKRCLFCGIFYVGSKAKHHTVELTPEGKAHLKTTASHVVLLDCPKCGAVNLDDDKLNERHYSKSKYKVKKSPGGK